MIESKHPNPLVHEKKPASVRALPWLYWMLFICSVSVFPKITSLGFANAFAQFLVAAVVFGGATYLIVFAIMSFMDRNS